MSLEGFGVGFRWVVGVGFLWKIKERRGRVWEGWGVGWGPAKDSASQCARVSQNYPIANYPLVSPRSQLASGPERKRLALSKMCNLWCPEDVTREPSQKE